MVLTLLFFHLVAVALLFAGMGIEIAAIVQLHRAATVADVRSSMQNGTLVSVFMGAGVALLLVMGIWLVYAGGFGWQPWNAVALIVTLILGVNGPITNGKRGEAIAARAAATPDGPITPELEAARGDRFWNYSVWLSVFELVVALYLMTNKPAMTQCLVAVALGALLPAIPVLFVARKGQKTGAGAAV